MTATLAEPRPVTVAREIAGPPRIGIVNLMPHAEQYERWLMPQFAVAPPFEPVWIRMAGRRYHLDRPEYIDGQYVGCADALAGGPLDALVVTGAAVEHLPFEEVRWLPELDRMVQAVAADRRPVLGLCWGANAVGHLLFGLPKSVYPTKVSGAYETERLVGDGPIAEVLDDTFWSTHSRYAGFDDAALDACPRVRAVARSAQAGTVIAESLDHGVVMHIGHPEYPGGRLAEEYRRDTGLGRDDVQPPANVDLDRPVNLWRSHSLAFFAAWVRLAHQRRAAR